MQYVASSLSNGGPKLDFVLSSAFARSFFSEEYKISLEVSLKLLGHGPHSEDK